MAKNKKLAALEKKMSALNRIQDKIVTARLETGITPHNEKALYKIRARQQLNFISRMKAMGIKWRDIQVVDKSSGRVRPQRNGKKKAARRNPDHRATPKRRPAAKKAVHKRTAKTPARRNPDHRTDRKAARVVKRFIGRATGKATKARHPGLKAGTTLANLKMRLDYLKLRHPDLAGGMIRFAPKERPLIASTPDGRQYHFIGGNQNLDVVPNLGVVSGKKQNPGGLRDLGEVVQLGYTARKHVDGFRTQAYFHNLGEENGKRPRLLYDPKQKQMYFVGGDYRTRAEGITN